MHRFRAATRLLSTTSTATSTALSASALKTRHHHTHTMTDRCYIVPPHLLQAIADSTHNEAGVRDSARACLAAREQVSASRKAVFAALTTPRGYHAAGTTFDERRQHIIPESMLSHLAESEHVDEETRTRAKRDLEHLQGFYAKVKASQSGKTSPPDNSAFLHTNSDTDETAIQSLTAKKKPKDTVYRAVYDAHHITSETALPGKIVRAEGEKAVTDKAVNDAFDNVGHVLTFYKEKFQWNSIDNKNMDVISSVHFGQQYENACK